MRREDVRAIQLAYPQVWYACHRHRPKDGGLTERESTILVHLAHGDLSRLPALAGHLGVGTSTLSEAIDGLVRRGFVQRRRHEDDRRKVDFMVTEAGLDALSTGSPLDPESLREALDLLDPNERRQAVEGMSLLARACRGLLMQGREGA